MKSKLKEVIIKRSKWMRGNGDGSLYKNGKMCCLGFASRQVGKLRIADINRRGMPGDLAVAIEGLSSKDDHGYMTSSDFSEGASEINDNQALTDKQRETQLKKLAKLHGFKFTFVD